jgi:iron complex outermembrane receptor protein
MNCADAAAKPALTRNGEGERDADSGAHWLNKHKWRMTCTMRPPVIPSRKRSTTLSVRHAVSRCLRRHHYLVGLSSASTLLLGSLAAHAQNTAASETPSSQGLEEIVVTAQRRQQSVQDIPYNISAFDGNQIAAAGAVSLNELTKLVPGLTSVDEGAGARGRTNNLTLRGLRTDSPGGGEAGAETPGSSVNAVSTYFGETPVFFPMPLYDIDRVEVLRGPQGTLYGSGALAGTIRVVPKRPDFTSDSAEIQLDANKSEHSTDPGRNVIGIGNLAISDTLAIRAVAGREHDGGFIDNSSLFARQGTGPFTVPIPSIPGDLTSGPVLLPTQKDTNYSDTWFTRGAIRWAPSESLDFQVDYLHQRIYSNNSSYSNPGFPGSSFDLTAPIAGPVSPSNPSYYPHSSFNIPPGGTYLSTAFTLSPYEDNLDLVSAVASVDFGLATMTSSSSFYSDRSVGTTDFTVILDSPASFNYNNYAPYNNYPRVLLDQPTQVNDRSFIQELRLVSNGKNRLDYVAGLYFQHEQGLTNENQIIPGITQYLASIGQPNPSVFGDDNYLYRRNTLFQDRAVFGELSFHATQKWQITAGVRVFQQSFESNAVGKLALCGAVCSTSGTDPEGTNDSSAEQKTSRAIKKLNTSYDVTPDMKVYATYSEGFRRGGANALPLAGSFASLPQFQSFTPDIAKNYEIGLKGTALDRRVRYSADIYRIDLNNFQFDAANPAGFAVTFNGKTARSQGVELELNAALTRDTSMSLGYAFTDAKVTRTFSIVDYAPYALAPGGTGQTTVLFGGPIDAGSRLPGVPKNTVSAGIDQIIPINMAAHEVKNLTLHVDGAYRSSATGDISQLSPYFWIIPSSFIGNLRATFDATNKVSYSAYINNFTSSPGYTGGSFVQSSENYSRFRDVSRPRAYGLSLRYQF